MTPEQEAVERFRAQVQVDIETYRATLAQLTAAEVARIDAHYQHHRQTVDRETQAYVQWMATSNRGMLDLGMGALKGVFLINGGAAIALLAFLGSVWQSRRPNAAAILGTMAAPMQLFVFGLVVAVAAGGLAYICQHYIVLRKDKLATALRWVCVCVTAVSLVLFCIGALKATQAFQVVPSPAPAAAANP
jgi:hypothetical protein